MQPHNHPPDPIEPQDHPNFFEFYDKLRQEEAFTEMTMEQLEAGNTVKGPTKMQAAKNKRLQTLTDCYLEDGESACVIDFLRCSYNISYYM
jgi:hypothetical protein